MKRFKFPIDETNYVQIKDGYDYGYGGNYRRLIAIYPYFPKSVDLATADQLQLIKSYMKNYDNISIPTIDGRLGCIKEILINDFNQAQERLFGCPSKRKYDPSLDEILESTLTSYQADRIIKAVNKSSYVILPDLLFYTDENGQYDQVNWF